MGAGLASRSPPRCLRGPDAARGQGEGLRGARRSPAVWEPGLRPALLAAATLAGGRWSGWGPPSPPVGAPRLGWGWAGPGAGLTWCRRSSSSLPFSNSALRARPPAELLSSSCSLSSSSSARCLQVSRGQSCRAGQGRAAGRAAGRAPPRGTWRPAGPAAPSPRPPRCRAAAAAAAGPAAPAPGAARSCGRRPAQGQPEWRGRHARRRGAGQAPAGQPPAAPAPSIPATAGWSLPALCAPQPGRPRWAGAVHPGGLGTPRASPPPPRTGEAHQGWDPHRCWARSHSWRPSASFSRSKCSRSSSAWRE